MSKTRKTTHQNVNKNPSRRVKKTDNSVANYKFKIGFTQSVSTGIVALEGYTLFNDNIQDAEDSLYGLVMSMKKFEQVLEQYGYLVAAKHAPKLNGGGGGGKE